VAPEPEEKRASAPAKLTAGPVESPSHERGSV